MYISNCSYISGVQFGNVHHSLFKYSLSCSFLKKIKYLKIRCCLLEKQKCTHVKFTICILYKYPFKKIKPTWWLRSWVLPSSLGLLPGNHCGIRLLRFLHCFISLPFIFFLSVSMSRFNHNSIN